MDQLLNYAKVLTQQDDQQSKDQKLQCRRELRHHCSNQQGRNQSPTVEGSNSYRISYCKAALIAKKTSKGITNRNQTFDIVTNDAASRSDSGDVEKNNMDNTTVEQASLMIKPHTKGKFCRTKECCFNFHHNPASKGETTML